MIKRLTIGCVAATVLWSVGSCANDYGQYRFDSEAPGGAASDGGTPEGGGGATSVAIGGGGEPSSGGVAAGASPDAAP